MRGYFLEVKKTISKAESDSTRLPYVGTFYLNANSIIRRIKNKLYYLKAVRNCDRIGRHYNPLQKKIVQAELRLLWGIKNRFGLRTVDNRYWKYFHGVGYIKKYNEREKQV